MRDDQCQCLAATKESARSGFIKHRQRGIGQDRKLHHQTLPKPVLGHIADARRHGGLCIGKVLVFAVEQQFAPVSLVDAEYRAGNFGAARSDKATQTLDHSGADGQTDAFKFTGAAEIL